MRDRPEAVLLFCLGSFTHEGRNYVLLCTFYFPLTSTRTAREIYKSLILYGIPKAISWSLWAKSAELVTCPNSLNNGGGDRSFIFYFHNEYICIHKNKKSNDKHAIESMHSPLARLTIFPLLLESVKGTKYSLTPSRPILNCPPFSTVPHSPLVFVTGPV